MLQWTGGSRRKVATSRKSTHSRQKQYFEQRKRQRQAPGQEHCATGCDKQVLCNAEPRSLDILNLINLAVASQQASTELTVPAYSCAAKISNDSLLGKVTGSYSSAAEVKRLEPVTNSSDSNLPQVGQTYSYKCADHVNKWKMAASVPEHTSSWPDDTFNKKMEKPQIEATVLDLLGDDALYSNDRSIPEAHVALSVEGLGKIGSQTPAHSPRMQNRFSCKGISIASKASRQACSTSALKSSHNDLNEELNSMIDDFRVSPLCSKGDPWDYVGTKTKTHKSRVTPIPPYSQEDQADKISIKGKGFNASLFSSNEKLPNDSFGCLEKQFNEESYDAASNDQRFFFEGYPFRYSSTKKFEKYETSNVGVRDTFLGSSRNLWEGGKIFEASAAPTHFRHPTSEKEGNPSFTWESDDTNADGIFDPNAWCFLQTDDAQDNISILSEDSNSPTAVRSKSSKTFGTHSMKPGKNKTNYCDKFQMYSVERSCMQSQDEDIFTGFDDTIWGKEHKNNSAFKKLDAENTFLSGQFFPSNTTSKLDAFSSFPMRKSTSSGCEAMSQHDHFDIFHTPKSKFEIPSECELPGDFIYQDEIFRKHSAYDFNSHIPIMSSSKAKRHGQYSSSGGDFCKEIHFTQLPKYQEYNEDRGSSGKPQPKDYEKRSTSSGNAESAAGAETLSKGSEHDESKNEIPEPFNSPIVKNSNEDAEVSPTMMEEFPTQIQNYVHSKINEFQGRSPIPSHPSNEGSSVLSFSSS